MTDYAPIWGSPEAATVRPAAIPKAGKIALGAIGALILAIVVATVFVGPAEDESGSPGGFYASAGWTVNRAVDLDASLRRDGGMSRIKADCVMKTIVADTTWLEWKSLGISGQVAEIKGAARSC